MIFVYDKERERENYYLFFLTHSQTKPSELQTRLSAHMSFDRQNCPWRALHVFVWLPYCDMSHPRAAELQSESILHGLLNFWYDLTAKVSMLQSHVVALYVDIPLLIYKIKQFY